MPALLPRTVRLIRRVAFSAGHRYWRSARSEEENRRLFGRWASPYNHGHNYVLEAEIEGPVDEQTGMVVNIKDLDAILQSRVVAVLDQKSLNDEVEWFADRIPSLENLLLFLEEAIGEPPSGSRLRRLRLDEMPTLWAELTQNGTRTMTLTRTYEFAASHRLHHAGLPEERNQELYGKCSNPAGHGHNYILEVTVEGDPDPETGMLVDLEALDRAVEERIVNRYDHRNLSVDLPEFHGKVATSEVVAQQIWKDLEGALPAKLARIRLHETARNAFEVVAE
jgi:6-pyruvoyltetrahydropterin/6-carboxytetrahydropterin synthase